MTVRQQLEAKYGKQQTPQGGVSIRAQLEAKYGKNNITTKYDVPEVSAPTLSQREQHKSVLAGALTDQSRYAQESDKANSPLGFATNFSKALVSNLAPSEVGLGKSIGQIAENNDVYVQAGNKVQDANLALIKLIRQKEARGEDTTKLKQIFNQNQKQVNELSGTISSNVANLPSSLKVAGQLGGASLDLLSAGTYGKATLGMKTGELALPGAAKLAAQALPSASRVVTPLAKSTGLFSKAGAARVAQGAGIGYAYDVVGGLAGNRGEDRTGAKALIPGLGTAIGGGIPLALEGERSVINAFNSNFTKEGRIANLEAKRLKALQDLKQAPLTKAVEKGKARGIDVRKVLSETDVLSGAVDKSGRITTKGEDGAIAQYTKEFVDGNEALVSEALKKEGRSISPQTVRAKLTRAIKESGIEGAELKKALNNVGDEIDGLSLRSGESGAIPLETIHNAKIDKYSDINFNTEASTGKYKKAIARAFKELVQENSKDVQVEAINKELAKHFAVIDYLSKLDGKTVKGGKLGKYFGQTVGAIVGSHFGPIGSVVGAEAGGRIKGELMSRVFGGKTGKVQPQAEAITGAKAFINQEPLSLPAKSVVPSPVINLPARTQSTIDAQEIQRIQSQLPQSSNNLGSRQISQATTITPTTNDIAKTIPQLDKEASVEKRASDKYTANPGQMVDEYLAQNGNIINTDDARKLFSDVGYKGYNSAAVHEPASAITNEALKRLIAKAKPGDEAFFLAGSSGSGKTSVVRGAFGEALKGAAFVLDGNLSNYQKATEKIKMAEKQGIKPTVAYVFRDPEEAWNAGVVSRMLSSGRDSGRVVPLKEFLSNLTGSLSTVKRLIDDGIPVAGFLNTKDSSITELGINEIKNINIPPDIKERLLKSVETLGREKKISKEQYEALLEGIPHVAYSN